MDTIYIKKLKMPIMIKEISNLNSKIQGVLPISHDARCEGELLASRIESGYMNESNRI
jgi:hypothetical protein